MKFNKHAFLLIALPLIVQALVIIIIAWAAWSYTKSIDATFLITMIAGYLSEINMALKKL